MYSPVSKEELDKRIFEYYKNLIEHQLQLGMKRIGIFAFCIDNENLLHQLLEHFSHSGVELDGEKRYFSFDEPQKIGKTTWFDFVELKNAPE